MLKVALVGSGAIARGVMVAVDGHAGLVVDQLLVTPRRMSTVQEECPDTHVATSLDALPHTPDVLLECAGHAAVVEHVLPALAQGIDCIVCSIGSLAEPALPEKLEAAASQGAAQVELVAGAIGAIDAIAAARIGG